MPLETILSIYGFSYILILIIFLHAQKTVDKNNRQDRVFMYLLFCTVVSLTFDMVSRLREWANIFPLGPISEIATFLLFAFHHIIALTWILYIDSQLNFSQKRTRGLRIFVGIVIVAQFVISLFNLKYHFFYSIDAFYVYTRGPVYFTVTLITFALLIMAYVFLFRHIKFVEKRYVLALILFAVPPVLGVVLQFLIVGSSFMLPGVVISILILFLNTQNRSIYTDYLTGVNNRKRLDRFLQEKISYAKPQKTFSAILVDIDNFKNFNDTYGHDLGDVVLMEAVEVLKTSVRSNDLIARYGGDEFCIVFDISNESDLQKAANRIKNTVKEYNQKSQHDFKLSFSMGCAVYDEKEKLKIDEFFKLLDQRMYQDKKNKLKK